jgi:carbamoyltransferase
VAHGLDYEPWSDVDELNDDLRTQYREVYSPEVQLRSLAQHFPEVDWRGRFLPVRHHDAHAASAYYPSGFREALIVVWDGMGEEDATTTAVGEGAGIRVLQRLPVPHSIGLLYGACTLHLGFAFGLDEYEVMGLAPYGHAERFFDP